MYVHTFGAYFGLAASYFFGSSAKIKESTSNAGGYNSQTIAMIGTLFLWMYWPSFNGALANENQQQRVIINTVMAISASCITACGISKVSTGKLNMEVVLNATLAGGVAVGSASDLVVTAGIAMAIGGFAGIVSALGFLRLGPYLQAKIGLNDTCGVHNLHGMPGVMGGLIGSLSAGFADKAFSGEKGKIIMINTFAALKDDKRTVGQQGLFQLAALGVTLAISISSGALAGFLASKVSHVDDFFEDDEHWDECEYDVVDSEEKPKVDTLPKAVEMTSVN